MDNFMVRGQSSCKNSEKDGGIIYADITSMPPLKIEPVSDNACYIGINDVDGCGDKNIDESHIFNIQVFLPTENVNLPIERGSLTPQKQTALLRSAPVIPQQQKNLPTRKAPLSPEQLAILPIRKAPLTPDQQARQSKNKVRNSSTKSRKVNDNDLNKNDINAEDLEEFYEIENTHETFLTRYVYFIVPTQASIQKNDLGMTNWEPVICCPPPIGMLLFSIVQGLAFIYDIYYMDIHNFNLNNNSNLSASLTELIIYDPDKRSEAWRFVTYMFVHADAMHVVGNLTLQILLGVSLEYVHRSWRVTLVYLAGVMAGSMGHSLRSPRTRLRGSSAGVCALLTAHIATIVVNFHNMKCAFVQFIVFFSFCIYTVIPMDSESRTSHAAHFSGALAGLLVGFFGLRILKAQTFHRRLSKITLLCFLIFMLIGIFIHILVPQYFSSDNNLAMDILIERNLNFTNHFKPPL